MKVTLTPDSLTVTAENEEELVALKHVSREIIDYLTETQYNQSKDTK